MKYQSPDPQKVNLIAQLPYLQKTNKTRHHLNINDGYLAVYELKKKL